jgi:quercetin dioxygenase-like cupin family protein
MDRSSGGALVVRLEGERGDAAPGGATGRRTRTLVKLGPLRATLIELDPGAVIAEHQAEGPITVQPLEGRLRFSAEGRDHDLGPGDLLALAPRVRHSVSSSTGARFLLTLATP